jgi:hypothetical protein
MRNAFVANETIAGPGARAVHAIVANETIAETWNFGMPVSAL